MLKRGRGDFGRGGGESSFVPRGNASRGGGGGNSFGRGGGDSFARNGEVSSTGRGGSSLRGFGSAGRGVGGGGGSSFIQNGEDSPFGNGGGDSFAHFGHNEGGDSFGRGGNGSSVRGGGESSFGSRGGNTFGRGGGDSFGRGRGDSSFARNGEDSPFGRGGSSVRGFGSAGRGVTPISIPFGTGSNSVELKQNTFDENGKIDDEVNFPMDTAKDTTTNQDLNNAATTNGDPTKVNRGFALRERLVDDLYKDDAIFKDQYVDIADADDDVMISGVNTKMILESWNELNLDDTLLENIAIKSNYIRPRKIQKHVIPYVISGYDLKGHSETGSGKTGAFLIPIIQKIVTDPLCKNQSAELPTPFALVLSPTRELCLQIYDQCRKFANGTFIKVVRAYGQFNFGVNLGQLQDGCHILIATTGRLLHLIKDKHIDLSQLKYFVLDEADRMLESSFLTSIREIIQTPNFPPKETRQSLIFSATFPPEIEELANEILRPGYVVASNNKPVSANNRVKQSFLNVENGKMECLKEILDKEIATATSKNPKNPKPRRTLVFVETRRDADRLSVYLCENNIKSLTLNGDRQQSERELALRKFDRGFIDVLVATDVCARGIDIKGLEHVINYDLPQDLVTYVHRIGRTGRLGVGYSTSFVDLNKNEKIIPDLIKLLRNSANTIPEFMLSSDF